MMYLVRQAGSPSDAYADHYTLPNALADAYGQERCVECRLPIRDVRVVLTFPGLGASVPTTYVNGYCPTCSAGVIRRVAEAFSA